MLKRPFIGLTRPWIRYTALPKPDQIRQIALPKQATIFFDTPFVHTDAIHLKPGDTVKTGQWIELVDDPAANRASTVAGAVSAVTDFQGDFGKSYTAVTIDVDADDPADDAFAAAVDSPDLETARRYLSYVAGRPPLDELADSEVPIHTVVILGVDQDLLVGTQQYVMHTGFKALQKGIGALRQMADVERVVLVVLRDSVQNFGHIDAEVMAVDQQYPAARPELVVRNVLGVDLPAGKPWQEAGISFFSAEAVAALGEAYATGAVPTTKTLTFIDKQGTCRLVSARLGTAVGDVLKAFGVTLNERDRLVLGGPMRGKAIYTPRYPIQADTDAILVQDAADIPYTSDYPCINCGECIPVCPANISVNMLVRVLEAGQYQDAVDLYDLFSCVDCGLCSAVCVSKIPILQYIQLGKYELKRLSSEAEAEEEEAKESDE
jgi:electron transport complex protein RnfC